MASFTARRTTRAATIRLAAPPDLVFPLFTPLGEKLWVEGWDPLIIYPPDGHAENGAVFTTHGHDDSDTVWVMTQFEPDRHQATYVRVSQHSHVATIAVQCVAEGTANTSATLTYTFTGLTAHGNEYVDTFSEQHYHEWLQQWELAINHYLEQA
jgi:hypothetical protein